MKFLSILMLCFSSAAFAQADTIAIPQHPNDKYSEFVRQLEAGQTQIDYVKFRESFIASPQFKIKGKQAAVYDSLKKEIYSRMREDDYKAIVRLSKAMLSIDYTSMHAHKILQQTYKILGDTVNKKKYKDIEFGLLRSIVNNGDGKSCATAWEVVQIEEEYFILDMLGADLKKQSIDNSGGICDKMEVKLEDGKKKTYYFGVSKVFASYKKE